MVNRPATSVADLVGDVFTPDMAVSATWAARWIAPSGAKHENYSFLARKAFTLSSVPAKAILRIAATLL